MRRLAIFRGGEDGEGMEDLKMEMRMRTEEFINSAGGAGEGRIIIIMNYDEARPSKAGYDELKADLDRLIEIAIKKSKGDLAGEIGGSKVGKPGFLDNNMTQISATQLGDDVALGD